ncbi:N-acetylmuramoyl-L-alanine amidase [Actinomadura rudentiformis]|uniref:N-acetylmuramoyl-L-alanine amidase n=2 Tax=Actinomadura rudentiformis TaxID=359158 RepID=A0A6H9Y9A6_9ACTN|nr:N-acetylmuramoyl-L-alanine amidase [Actinomadura rudentiformis]
MAAGLAENMAMAEIIPAGAAERPVPTRPRVYTREEWGARRARKPTKIVERMPDRIVVHHTATPNTTNYSLEHAYRLSRDIQRFHMRHRGWNDTGQHLTISRGGHVMEGRDSSLSAILAGRHAIGAQARRHNDHTIGIENEGNYKKAPVPELLWSSLVTVCTWLCAEYQLDPDRAIVGHRDLGDTECPGDALYSRLPELRKSVSARLPRPDGASESNLERMSTSLNPEVADTPTHVPSSVVPSPEILGALPSPGESGG